MEIANLFWHGEVTELEKVCVKSFVKQGFHTKIWSYTGIEIDGAESCDARLVFPEEDLTKYKHKHFMVNDDSKSQYSSIAAFSDAFRYSVVEKFGGWWFDADCYCLKSSDDFARLRENKQVIVGIQNYFCPMIANGVLYANSDIASKLVSRTDEFCKQHNYILNEWGIIGPRLVGDVVQDNDLVDCVVSTDKFYSIWYDLFNYFIDPNLKDLAKSYIANSYIAHVWHSQLDLHNIDRNNPPENSLLKEFYAGSYINNVPENIVIQLKYNIALERYITISKLYKKILRRSGDVNVIARYVETQMSYGEIEQIILQSEEYKKLNNSNNQTCL